MSRGFFCLTGSTNMGAARGAPMRPMEPSTFKCVGFTASWKPRRRCQSRPQTRPPAAGDAAEAHLSQPGAAPGTPATRDTH